MDYQAWALWADIVEVKGPIKEGDLIFTSCQVGSGRKVCDSEVYRQVKPEEKVRD